MIGWLIAHLVAGIVIAVAASVGSWGNSKANELTYEQHKQIHGECGPGWKLTKGENGKAKVEQVSNSQQCPGQQVEGKTGGASPDSTHQS